MTSTRASQVSIISKDSKFFKHVFILLVNIQILNLFEKKKRIRLFHEPHNDRTSVGGPPVS